MHIIPSRMPEPRLLVTAAREQPKSANPVDESKVRCRLKGESLFSGNGRAIFVGIAVGGLLLCGAGALFERYNRLKQNELHVPKVLAVATEKISNSVHSSATPRPVVVQLDANLLRVTAIVLGHPRLAVINGRSLAEGDNLVLHAPTMSVAITLRVLRISDGRIELTDGTQTITAQLNVPAPVKTASK
jgi:hypothetical protein